MATIKQRIDTVTDNVIGGKSDIASAITDIGVPATSAETFNSLANKIKQTQDGKYVSTTYDRAWYMSSGRNEGITGIEPLYNPGFENFTFLVSKTEQNAFIVPEFNFAITNGQSFSDYEIDFVVDTMEWEESSVPSFLKFEYLSNTGIYVSYDGSNIPNNKIYNVLLKPVIYYDEDNFENGRRWFYITFRNKEMEVIQRNH